jgi:hypothetical protein
MIDGPKLSQIYEKTGQKDFTLAFVLGSSKGCDPKWGAEKDLDDPMIIGEIRKVQAHGGQMIVALGKKRSIFIFNSFPSKVILKGKNKLRIISLYRWSCWPLSGASL